MQRSLFFDGQDVQLSDIDNVEVTKVAELKRRITDISTQQGIITGLAVTNPSAFVLEVAVGTAYDSNGEVIIVPASPLANRQITVNAGQVGEFLVIDYVSVDGTPIAHPITGVLNDTRRTDSFVLSMDASPVNPSVVLATLTALDGGGNATLDVLEDPLGPRVFWSARIAQNQITDEMLVSSDGVIVHINTFGTGTVSGDNPHGLSPADVGFVTDTTPLVHQRLDHGNGIEQGSSTNAGLTTVNAGPAPDELTITNLVSGDNIIINGVRLDDTTGISPTTLTFGSAGVNPELYEVTLSELGVAAAVLRASYTGAKTITGVQVVDVSATHATGNFVLNYVAAGNGSLAWDNGPVQILDDPLDSFDGDKFYILRRSTDAEDAIRVHVDFSAIPVGDQSDTINIIATTVGKTQFLLATAPWSGSATGFLGFGDDAASGVAFDKRIFGNMDADQLGQASEDLVHTYLRETRADGMVDGGTVVGISGLDVTIESGVGYCNGIRFIWNQVSPQSLTDNDISYIWVDELGVVQVTDYSPNSVPKGITPSSPIENYSPGTAGGAINQVSQGTGGAGFSTLGAFTQSQVRNIALAQVTTSGGAVTAILDQRSFLIDVDRFHKHNHKGIELGDIFAEDIQEGTVLGFQEWVGGPTPSLGGLADLDAWTNEIIVDLNDSAAASSDGSNRIGMSIAFGESGSVFDSPNTVRSFLTQAHSASFAHAGRTWRFSAGSFVPFDLAFPVVEATGYVPGGTVGPGRVLTTTNNTSGGYFHCNVPAATGLVIKRYRTGLNDETGGIINVTLFTFDLDTGIRSAALDGPTASAGNNTNQTIDRTIVTPISIGEDAVPIVLCENDGGGSGTWSLFGVRMLTFTEF